MGAQAANAISGYTGTVFFADLGEKTVKTFPLDRALAENFLGTRGFAAKLLYDYAPAGLDPLSPENPLIFATGPLTGTAAFGPSGYFGTVSPLTGGYLDSGVRGHLAANVKLAGFDAFVITGKAKTPVYLWITDGTVEIRDAAHLWGKDAFETDTIIKKEIGLPEIHVAAIGPAGENLVRYACISSDLYRQAGRGGAGAVMGSKNLKAIAAKGNGAILLSRPDDFLRLLKELQLKINQDAEPLRSEGTLWLVDSMNRFGLLPTRNFRCGVFSGSKQIDGPYAKKKTGKRNAGCFACSLMCSNRVTVSSARYGTFSIEGPEYETTALLGPNCGLGNFEEITSLNRTCDRLGIDTMSAGVVISFAMELYERGIITKTDTNGFDLSWGNAEAMESLLDNIAYRKGFGGLLAEGSRLAAKIIGGGAPKYAMQVKGMEMPGYDPRGVIGMALAYATADRGACHLRAWTIYEELMGSLSPQATEGKAALVSARQNRKATMDSLGICEQVGLLPIFADLLSSAVGWDVRTQYNDVHKKLLEDFQINGAPGVGARIYTLTRAFNTKRGFSRKDDTLPDRFFHEPLLGAEGPGPVIHRDTFESLLDDYYRIRGWDMDGKPTKATLEKYGLTQAVKDLY
jgi:aldehyde:ferredoxin oxidoreductase